MCPYNPGDQFHQQQPASLLVKHGYYSDSELTHSAAPSSSSRKHLLGVTRTTATAGIATATQHHRQRCDEAFVEKDTHELDFAPVDLIQTSAATSTPGMSMSRSMIMRSSSAGPTYPSRTTQPEMEWSIFDWLQSMDKQSQYEQTADDSMELLLCSLMGNGNNTGGTNHTNAQFGIRTNRQVQPQWQSQPQQELALALALEVELEPCIIRPNPFHPAMQTIQQSDMLTRNLNLGFDKSQFLQCIDSVYCCDDEGSNEHGSGTGNAASDLVIAAGELDVEIMACGI